MLRINILNVKYILLQYEQLDIIFIYFDFCLLRVKMWLAEHLSFLISLSYSTDNVMSSYESHSNPTEINWPMQCRNWKGAGKYGEQLGFVLCDVLKTHLKMIHQLFILGNYIYVADLSCVRIYNIKRKRVATLAGVCGRMENSPTLTTASAEFRGHLKLAVSARDVYVLDSDTISRVDRETGAVWVLTQGKLLHDGKPTSIGKQILCFRVLIKSYFHLWYGCLSARRWKLQVRMIQHFF